METRTPILRDKRFLLVSVLSLLVLLLVALDREPSEAVLTWLGGVAIAYVTQSQWGQTKRATTARAQP